MAGTWTASACIEQEDSQGWQETRFPVSAVAASGSNMRGQMIRLTCPSTSATVSCGIPSGLSIHAVAFRVVSGDGATILMDNLSGAVSVYLPGAVGSPAMTSMHAAMALDSALTTGASSTLTVVNKTGTATATVVEVALACG